MADLGNIKPLKLLYIINPDNMASGDAEFVYSSITKKYEEYDQQRVHERQLIEEIQQQIDKTAKVSLDEHKMAELLMLQRKLIEAAIGMVTNKHDEAVRAKNEALFTDASIKLYGQPDESVARNLVHDLVKLKDKASDDLNHHKLVIEKVLKRFDLLKSQEQLQGDKDFAAIEKQVLGEIRQFLNDKYGYLFEHIELKKIYQPADIAAIIDQSLQDLGQKGDKQVWEQWQSKVSDKYASITVVHDDKLVYVPQNRPATSGQELKGLIAHELLVHCRRSSQARINGLDSFKSEKAEEGLGALYQRAIDPETKLSRYANRFLDVYLCLKTDDEGLSLTREELLEFVLSRELLSSGRPSLGEADVANLRRHVDRIYRGGLGDNSKRKHPIFTKDTIYYAGYLQNLEFIADQLNQETPFSSVDEYLTQGQFDPNDDLAREYISKAKLISLD